MAVSLVEEGRLDLDAPVSEQLPDVDRKITARHLLSHSSGLPAWLPLYERFDVSSWGRDEVRAEMLRVARMTPLQATPGERHIYSDLGFLTFLSLCEELTSTSWAELVGARVLGPRSADLRWGWPGAAATQACSVRGEVTEGVVDDLNCAALGGVSSHAGLFGSARVVAALVDRFGESIGSGGVWRQFAEYQGPGAHRLGFDSISPGYSSTGHHFPADTVGHLGFTGTSAWTSPSRRTTVVLLTNRLHPSDVREDIREARPVVHDAVAELLGWGEQG